MRGKTQQRPIHSTWSVHGCLELAEPLGVLKPLPERCFGLKDADLPVSAKDASQEDHGLAEADASGDLEGFAEESERRENVTNEPKLDEDVITAQLEENVEVVANSGAISGLDSLRTNPRAGGGREEAGDAKSKDDGDPNSKIQIRNSKFEIRNLRKF